MDLLRKQIRKEIKHLMEGKTIAKFPAPPIVREALSKLFPGNVNRYVNSLKAASTIPPSYRVFLIGGNKFFDLYLEKVSVVVKIGAKEYWLMNDDETMECQHELNRLLTKPTLNIKGDEETDSSDKETGGSSASDTAMETEPEESPEEPEEPEA